jgi:hypothetical protein
MFAAGLTGVRCGGVLQLFGPTEGLFLGDTDEQPAGAFPPAASALRCSSRPACRKCKSAVRWKAAKVSVEKTYGLVRDCVTGAISGLQQAGQRDIVYLPRPTKGQRGPLKKLEEENR